MTVFTNEGSQVSVNQHCAEECVAPEVRGGVCNVKFKWAIEDNLYLIHKPFAFHKQPVVIAAGVSRSLQLLSYRFREWGIVNAFANLRKATISFVTSVCLSVCPSVRPHGTPRHSPDGFSWNLTFECFSKICPKYSSFIKNLTKITGTLHEDQCTFLITSRSFLLKMRNFADKIFRQNENTHFVFNNLFRKIVPFLR